jgi:hypothetical protein
MIFRKFSAALGCSVSLAAILASGAAFAVPQGVSPPASGSSLSLDANSQLLNANTYLQRNQLPPLASSYLGVVASGAFTNNSLDAKAYVQTRWPQVMRGAVTSGKLAYVLQNFYTQPGSTETAPASMTCTGSLEYPQGTFQQMTSGASASVTVAANSLLVTDYFANPPPVGATFWTWLYCNETGGVPERAIGIPPGAYSNHSTTAMTDYTMTGPGSSLQSGAQYPGSNLGYGIVPVVIGQTKSRSVAGTGDSRMGGTGDTFDGASPTIGHVCRSVDAMGAACLNLGIGSDTASAYIASHANRLALANYASDQIWAYPVNDIYSGAYNIANLSTVQGWATTFKSYFSASVPVSIVTIYPESGLANGAITALTANNGAQLSFTIQFNANYGLFIGETIVIAGATNTQYNGPCIITSLGATNTCLSQNPALSYNLTFSAAISAATSTPLASNWPNAPGTYTVSFSDGSTRQVTLTNGATTAAWTTAVTASASASATPSSVGVAGTITFTTGWQDTIYQTLNSSGSGGPLRVAYNAWCRSTAVSLGFKACLDLSGVLESGQGSSMWSSYDAAGRQTTLTVDGTHANATGYLKIMQSKVISAPTLY